MKNSKTMILVFISIIIFILGIKAQGNSETDAEILVKAFNQTGAEFDSYWLHIGLPFTEYSDDKQLLAIGNQLSTLLMLPNMSELQKNGAQNIYVSKGTWGKASSAELLLKRESDQSKQIYLIFRIEGDQSLEDFKNFYTILEKKLQKTQISPIIMSCVQGNINDKLSDVDQFVLIDKVLDNLSAKEVEKLNTELVKSISAYSSKIKNQIWTSNHKMNLQVATHVNQQDKKTVITMGTPIITIEY